MGYLADYQHDVFVSYAHGDQISPWSQALCTELTATLNDVLERKGANGVNVWMDDKLEGNVGLTEQLQARVEGSAVIVIIMSNFYLDSPWCAQEANWFSDICKQRTDGGRDRLFVVRYRETNEERWPRFLKDSRGHALEGYHFYAQDRNAEADIFPFGYPVPQKADAASQTRYYAKIQNLAGSIKKKLQEIAKVPAPAPVAAAPAIASRAGLIGNTVAAVAIPASKGPTVYLGVGTEDVDIELQDVRSKLTEAGFDVIPPAADQTPAAAKQTLSALPVNCSQAVFVLGSLPGRKARIDDQDLVAWQHGQAKAGGLKIATWLPPHLTVAGLRDPDYRAFVEQLQLTAAADGAAFVATLPKPPPPGSNPGRLVFLDRPDATAAAAAAAAAQIDVKLRAILRELKVTVLPMTRAPLQGRNLATVERERQDLRQKRAICDRIMLLLENPNFMPEDWWIDIQSDVVPKAKPTLRCAVLDAVGSDLVSSDEVTVFSYASPSLRDEIQAWLTQ